MNAKNLNGKLLEEIRKFDDPSCGQNLRLIAEKLQVSKQNLNNHIKRLLDRKFIIKVKSYPYAVYKLTEKGRRVNEILGHSEKGVKTEWRCHNLILGFRILKWGSWTFGKTTPMNNWSYQQMDVLGVAVHVQTTGLIKAYIPESIGEDPENERIKGSARAQEIARWFIDKYDMELSPMLVIRKGQKTLLKSGDLARFLGRFKTDEIFVDASEGEENLEEPEDSHMIEDILDMPKQLNEIERVLGDKLTPAIDALARQIELHLEVMNGIKDGIKELRETLRPPAGEDMVEIEIVAEIPRFSHDLNGSVRFVGPFHPGARIYLPGPVAEGLISQGKGKAL